MKKTLTILTSVIVIILMMLSYLNRLTIKNIHNFSSSLNESKKNGLLSHEYIPLKKVIKLKLRPEKIILEMAWTEFSWKEEPTFLSSRIVKLNGKNIAIKITSVTTEDFVYSLRLIENKGNSYLAYNPMTKQHEGELNEEIDTLKFLLEEKNIIDSLGWKKPIQTDTIYFVKKTCY